MKLIASGYVYDARSALSHRRSCARTAVALLHDGTLLVSFRRGSDRESLDGHACIMASTDQGATWQERYDGYGVGAWDGTPGEVKGFFVGECEAGKLHATGFWVDMSRPELPFINPRTQGLLPMRTFHTISVDGGRTWGPWRRMDTSPHLAVSPASSPPLSLPGRVLAQPYETWKEYDDPSPGRPGAYLRLSYDDGRTWPESVTVAQHPENALYYWDQRLATHPKSGQWVSMFWTHDPIAQVDRDVHIAWGSPDGRSWSVPTATGLPGQHCQPIPVGGDGLVAVYACRRDPPGIVASYSPDFGRTWDRSRDVVVYDSTVGTESGAHGPRTQKNLWNDMIAWRFGHPRGLQLPSGDVFVVYYAGDNQYKSARWARLTV